MAENQLLGRDDIERMKIYVEIVKYAIVIVIALATVSGTLLKMAHNPGALFGAGFAVGIIFNIAIFFVGHRLTSEALHAITNGVADGQITQQLREINRSTYSLFVVLFLLSLVYWTILIGFSAFA